MQSREPVYHLNIDYPPIVYMRQIGRMDDRFDTLLQQLGELLSREAPILLVWDARGCEPATAAQRAAAADFIKGHWAQARQYCITAVFVVDSKLLRGAVTATMWLVKPPFSVEVVNTRDELIACLRGYAARKMVNQALVERFLEEPV